MGLNTKCAPTAFSTGEAEKVKRRCRTAIGFTLVELLVAMTVFATVAILAFTAMRLAARDQEGLARNADLETAAAMCLERMAKDLASLYVPLPPVFTPPLEQEPASEFRVAALSDAADDAILQFASLAHVSFEDPPRRGIARISYTPAAEENARNLIRRADHLLIGRDISPDGADPVLCEHVKRIQVYFYGWDGEMVDDWDSEAERYGYATPRAIRIELQIAAGGYGQQFETTVYLPVQREPATPAGREP
jgi:type II secretion system protein J